MLKPPKGLLKSLEMTKRTEGRLLMLTTSSFYANSEAFSEHPQECSQESVISRAYPPQLKSCTLWYTFRIHRSVSCLTIRNALHCVWQHHPSRVTQRKAKPGKPYFMVSDRSHQTVKDLLSTAACIVWPSRWKAVLRRGCSFGCWQFDLTPTWKGQWQILGGKKKKKNSVKQKWVTSFNSLALSLPRCSLRCLFLARWLSHINGTLTFVLSKPWLCSIMPPPHLPRLFSFMFLDVDSAQMQSILFLTMTSDM